MPQQKQGLGGLGILGSQGIGTQGINPNAPPAGGGNQGGLLPGGRMERPTYQEPEVDQAMDPLAQGLLAAGGTLLDPSKSVGGGILAGLQGYNQAKQTNSRKQEDAEQEAREAFERDRQVYLERQRMAQDQQQFERTQDLRETNAQVDRAATRAQTDYTQEQAQTEEAMRPHEVQGAAAGVDQTQAQTQNLQARTQTEEAMRGPKLQGILADTEAAQARAANTRASTETENQLRGPKVEAAEGEAELAGTQTMSSGQALVSPDEGILARVPYTQTEQAKVASQQPDRSVDPEMQTAILNELDRRLNIRRGENGEIQEGTPISTNAENAVLDRATQIYQNQPPNQQNYTAAVQEAIKQVTSGQGLQETGGGMFSSGSYSLPEGASQGGQGGTTVNNQNPSPSSGGSNGAQAGSLPQVSNEAEYNNLPPGTRYRDPDGNVRVKGGGQ